MKKCAPYILILLTLVGLFSPIRKAGAQFNPPPGKCWKNGATTAETTRESCEGPYGIGGTWQENGQPEPAPPNGPPLPNSTTGQCWKNGVADPRLTEQYCNSIGGTWQKSSDPNPPANPPDPNGPTTTPPTTTTPAEQTASKDDRSEFQNEIEKLSCINLTKFDMGGCVVKFLYYALFIPSAFILETSATFLNAVIAIALNSVLFAKSTFIPTAWGVVRDLSNIFFILILLFIAIRIILDLDSAGAKKMIARVLIIALLINFSMFFTQVVIDSSNILALIFYNKMDVCDKDPNTKKCREYAPSTNTNEKDLSGSMYNHFDATKLLSKEFFEKTKLITFSGKQYELKEQPTGIMIGIILIAATIMLFAAYAFLWSGLAFVGRMIELWMLIIFSPFAFMSSTVPKLAGFEYLGWKAWLSRLLTVSFMAPIFMFFLYLIFLLLQPPGPFGNMITGQNATQTILLVVIPAVIILLLLMKATEFAKKGSGKFGEVAMAGLKMVGGAALGAATGGASLALTSTVGAHYQGVANDDNLRAAASGDKEHFDKLALTDKKYEDPKYRQKMQAEAQKKLATANKYAGKSFDIRDTGLGKFAAKKAGLDLNAGTGALGLGPENLKGGAKGRQERENEEHQKNEKSYQMTGAVAMRQDDRAKDPKQPQNIRATEYEKDLKEAKEKGFVFNEKSEKLFKRDYEKGDDLRRYGLDKQPEKGTVEKIQTSKDINESRRRAYANSLDNGKFKADGTKNEYGSAMSRFFDNYKKGVGEAMSHPGTIAVTLGAGAVTGGVGLAVAPIAGAAWGFVRAFQEQVKGGRSTTAELVSAVRKGEDPGKKQFKELKHLLEHKPGNDDHAGKAATIIKDIITPPAAASEGAADHGKKPAGGGGDSHGH